MVNFIGVLPFAKSTIEEGFPIKRFILKHFNPFTTACVVLWLLRHSKKLANLVLGKVKFWLRNILYNNFMFLTHLFYCDWHHHPTKGKE